MAGISIKVDGTVFRQKMKQLGVDVEPKKTLKLIGEAWRGEIDRTFKRGGRPEGKWKPLAASTIAGRRGGGGGAQILRDTGELMQSFSVKKLTRKFIVVGSNLPRAGWHQDGTRPYTILPKSGKVLRWIGPDGPVFAKKVNHPGLPARPMLPSERTGAKIADKVLKGMLRIAARKFNA